MRIWKVHQITIGASVGKALLEATQQVVVCDEEGRALGFFWPVRGAPFVSELQLEPPLSISQTEALRKNRTGKPLEKILGRLGW
jgi:hypothetical protein